MKKVFTASIISSMIIFSGCGATGDENNSTSSCGSNLDMLSGDNPVITLEGETNIEIPLGTNTILEDGDRYCAYDPQDGELTEYVQRTNNIDFERVGEYAVTYTVEDSDGYTDTKIRTVTIRDNQYDDSYDNSEQQGILDNTNYDDNYDDGLSDNVDLGEEVNGDPFDNYTPNNSSTSLDDFKNWYSSVCGQNFSSSLYNTGTGKYSGTIDCSGRSLQSIDLSYLSIFSAIDTINLSHNSLTDIDFTPIQDIQGLNHLYINNNTATLKSKYDTVSERNALFNFFTNLHGGDGKTGLFIGFKPQHQQDSDEETLRVGI